MYIELCKKQICQFILITCTWVIIQKFKVLQPGDKKEVGLTLIEITILKSHNFLLFDICYMYYSFRTNM